MDTHFSQVRTQNLSDMLRRTAQRSPEKAAIICGETRWSYKEFDVVCNWFANGLRDIGVGHGDVVAILSRNSHSFAASRFALARIGAVLTPINFMLGVNEIRYILESSGAKVLAVGPDFIDSAIEAVRGTGVKRLIWLPGEHASEAPETFTPFDELLSHNGGVPDVAVSNGDLAQIIYTSGTESLPKGAMLTHEAVTWQYVSCVLEGSMEANDVILHALPLYHCAQLDVFLGPAVYLGSENIIIGNPTPDSILRQIEERSITSFFAPPTIWIGMLRSPNFAPSRLTSLRKGYYGASIMPVEVLLEMQRRLPEVRFWNFYGQTEMAPLATVLKPEDQLRKAGSAGRPAINVETRVVSTDMVDVAVGEVGEIVHRSPHLLSGYFNDPEKTEAAFAGGWFHSGDLGTIDDEGYLTVVDRMKDMIKSGGENISSREVEEAVYGLAEVSEVAVVGLPDPKWVEAVTAFVIIKNGMTLSEEKVREHCSSVMANFKVPKRVIFVENLPRNPSGKLLKRDLRTMYAGRAEA